VIELVASRDPHATVCPSEVARLLAAHDPDSAADAWRDQMPNVHAVVDQLLKDRVIGLSWKGSKLTSRSGPYRIGRGVDF
jgi:hypothetical protein